MLENIPELFNTIITSPLFAGAVTGGAIMFDRQQLKGWSLVLFAILSTSGYLAYQPEAIHLLQITPTFFIVGVLFSFLKYNLYCKDVMVKYKKGEYTQEHALDMIVPSTKINDIIYWIFNWPAALINTVSDTSGSLFKTVFDKIYGKIQKRWVKKINQS